MGSFFSESSHRLQSKFVFTRREGSLQPNRYIRFVHYLRRTSTFSSLQQPSSDRLFLKVRTSAETTHVLHPRNLRLQLRQPKRQNNRILNLVVSLLHPVLVQRRVRQERQVRKVHLDGAERGVHSCRMTKGSSQQASGGRNGICRRTGIGILPPRPRVFPSITLNRIRNPLEKVSRFRLLAVLLLELFRFRYLRILSFPSAFVPPPPSSNSGFLVVIVRTLAKMISKYPLILRSPEYAVKVSFIRLRCSGSIGLNLSVQNCPYANLETRVRTKWSR